MTSWCRQNFDKKLSRIKSLLGQQHPDYRAWLCKAWRQRRRAGMDAEAERLIAESVESSERSLGPWHPDHVAAVVFLAGVYREAGKYDRADALLSQARRQRWMCSVPTAFATDEPCENWPCCVVIPGGMRTLKPCCASLRKPVVIPCTTMPTR